MNLQMQKRLLIIGTIFTLVITSGVFTYFIHSQNESARIQTIENKLKGDANSILAHLYSSGNWAWFDDTLSSYKKLGVTCLNVKNKMGGHVWGNKSESCSKNIEGRNYIDQKIMDISYDLPEVTVLSTVKSNGLSFAVFFATMLGFLTLAYWLFKKITNAHTKSLIEIENLNSLNEANRNLLQITKTLAHNLRSPLAAIKTFNELAESKLDDNEKKILTATHESIFHMVEKLIEQKTMKVENLPTSISNALESVVGMKKVEYKKALSVEFKLSIDSGLHAVVNEPEFMSIISNLVNNSIEARKESAPIKIEVTASKNAHDLTVKIKDNGIGINAYNLQSIFAYGRTTKENGKGCGLYHAKEMIESWHGKIEINSVEDQFTEVIIHLPLYRTPKEIVLIDNEELNLVSWEGMARSRKIPFKGFKNSQAFFADTSIRKNEVAIYVDYDLDEENGLDVIMKLKESGFSNVVLATGEDERIHPMVSQVGKEFPQ